MRAKAEANEVLGSGGVPLVPALRTLTSVAAFAGAGGIEKGFADAGIHAGALIEVWDPARLVLARRFPEAILHGDISKLKTLPKADVFAGGFPCTDLSQAGLTGGIDGKNSGLVYEMFKLLPQVNPTWLVLENVQNMLWLDKGRAMAVLVTKLESLGYRWAYRVVNSQSFGVPQRRMRVLLVASRTEDPRGVLFVDDDGPRRDSTYRTDACGFYTTEGNRGLGWAVDAVPTLKGSSTIGIPSPPGIWVPEAAPGRRIVKPRIEDGEAMQGFRRGWTGAAQGTRRSCGHRWKLVGNAVTVPVARWLGGRLVAPASFDATLLGSVLGDRWPDAACGGPRTARREVTVTDHPRRLQYKHLLDVIDADVCEPVSLRSAGGFLDRLKRSNLTREPAFVADLELHVKAMKASERH
jgi:DNA (cytosine-5)-methyltransferase 1